MDPKEKLEAAVRRAKIEWRRIVDSPKSTPSERNRALANWKRASTELDLKLALLRRNLAERRGARPDRRKAAADDAWIRQYGDRRKMERRSQG